MKKLIAILAIAIVLVGAVFADDLPAKNSSESHTITLKTVVSSVLPQFKLTASSNNNTESTNPDLSTSAAAKIANDASYTGTGIVEVADISVEDIVATFTASLENLAKTGGTYRLSFEAGTFQNVWKVVGTEVKKDQTIAPSTTTAPSLAKPTSGAAGVGLVIADPSGSSIDITFNGQECTTGALAVYTVQYDKDDTVVDNDGEGYTVDIKMTITFQG